MLVTETEDITSF